MSAYFTTVGFGLMFEHLLRFASVNNMLFASGNLVGGYNPSEKYESKWDHFQNFPNFLG